MMEILEEVAPVGANLVSLHAQAYEKIRTETGLPARLVTLGLRDRAGYARAPRCAAFRSTKSCSRSRGRLH